MRENERADDVEVYFGGARVRPGERKVLQEGDKRPIVLRLRSETATLTIQWKEVCLRYQDAKAVEGVDLFWWFETHCLSWEKTTDYEVWVKLEDKGCPLFCAYLQYDSEPDHIQLMRPPEGDSRIDHLVKFHQCG